MADLDIQDAPKLDIQGAVKETAKPLDIKGVPEPEKGTVPIKLDLQYPTKPPPTVIASAPEPGLLQKMNEKLPPSTLSDEIKNAGNWLIGQGKDLITHLPDAAAKMYNEVSNTGKIAAQQVMKGDIPGAFNTVTEPVQSAFHGLEGMAISPPTVAKKGDVGKAAEQGIEMATGIPASDIWDKFAKGQYGAGVGEGIGAGLLLHGMGKVLGGPETPVEKPRYRVNNDGTFTNLADGTVMDKAGNPVPTTPTDILKNKLDQSRTKNVQQAEIYRQERIPKFDAASQVTSGGAEGADSFMSALGGEHTKVQIEPLKLKPDEMDNIYNTVLSNERYQTTDKAHALTGLKKLENGDVPQDNEIDAINKFFGFKEDDVDDPNRMFNIVNSLSSLSGKMTRMVLGFHIPGTAFGFHGINEGIRNAIFGPDFNPISAIGRGLEAGYYLARPNKANDYLDMNQPELDRAINRGLRVTTPDVQADTLFKGNNFLTKGLNYLTDPKPLFQQVIPALKLKAYTAYRDQMINWGVDEKTAESMAAYNTNNQFGGVSQTGWMANETNRKLFRIALLAPDWMASNYRLGSGMVESLANPMSPQGRMYRVGITNFLGAYAALNVLNAMNNNGKFMTQNDTGHEMDVAYGRDSMGRVRYFSPFGTALDAIRLPMGVVHAAITGQVGQAFQDARSRLSEPLQMAADLLTNTDFAGRPLYDRTKYGKPISIGKSGLNISTDVLDHIAPVGAQAIADYSAGKISEEELVMKLLQAPMRYKFPPRGK